MPDTTRSCTTAYTYYYSDQFCYYLLPPASSYELLPAVVVVGHGELLSVVGCSSARRL